MPHPLHGLADPESASLDDELLLEVRRRREHLDLGVGELTIEATLLVADDETALHLRQRQIAVIVRLLRHAVAMRQPE